MTRTLMKTLFAVVALAASTTSARAAERGASMTAADAARADMKKTFGFTPEFFLRFPDAALPGLWDEMKGLEMNPHTMLPDAEINEAIAMASLTRNMSTLLNGLQVDEAQLR